MNKKYNVGRKGEKIATEYLRKQGYDILENNFRGVKGEIDIIAKEDDELVFIEVKTRSNNMYGLPREAIDKAKLMRIYQTSLSYIYSKHIENYSIRYDAIEIYLDKNQECRKIEHLKEII